MATPPDFTSGAILTAAQMNQIGLWKVTPSAVSGTGVSIAANGDVILNASPEPYITAFSADFDYYRIFCNLTAFTGGAASLTVRPASGATPNTTAGQYRNSGYELGYTGSMLNVQNPGGSAGWNVGRVDSVAQIASFTMEIRNPFDSALYMSYTSDYVDSSFTGHQNGYIATTASYNGFNPRIGGTNTMTGVISIYGYNV